MGTPSYADAGRNAIKHFCTYEDWAPYLPPELRDLGEPYWQEKSRAGAWCQFIRVNGQRSTAYWPRTGIWNWFVLKWQILFPEQVQALHDSSPGFEPAPDQTPIQKNKTRRAKATEKAQKNNV